jgi:ElaB/YqjD/DUF883 family membrane-anchored ribosome-binding protein
MTPSPNKYEHFTAAKADAATMASAAGEQVADVAAQVQQVAKAQLDGLADAIRRRPIQATGIAAGIGFLLAVLARR